jgi:hypothetical protein
MAAYDPELVGWLEGRGYNVEGESPEQYKEHVFVDRIPDSILRALHFGENDEANSITPRSNITLYPKERYINVPGIAIPRESVSASHLQIEPHLQTQHFEPLGLCLSSLKAIWDGGLRKHYLIDNRAIPAPDQSSIAYRWG